jgi:hypothetical protein
MADNSKLDRLLKSAGAPEPSSQYWSEFAQRAMARRPQTPETQREPQWNARPAWGLVTVAAAIVFGLFLWLERPAQPADALLQNVKVIEETMALFPNRVRAITADENGLKIAVSDRDDVPVSPPIWMRLCDGKHCVTLVTFSGQEVEVDGQQITALANPQGHVLLVGENFVWSDASPSPPPGFRRFEARQLAWPISG